MAFAFRKNGLFLLKKCVSSEKNAFSFLQGCIFYKKKWAFLFPSEKMPFPLEKMPYPLEKMPALEWL